MDHSHSAQTCDGKNHYCECGVWVEECEEAGTWSEETE